MVARHVGSPHGSAEPGPSPVHLHATLTLQPAERGFEGHASHVLFRLLPTGEACLVEPDVECVHCGFCQSHGY